MDISTHDAAAADRLAKKLAGRLRMVNWAWLVLSLFLLGSMVGIVAGAWNIYVTINRWKLPAMIERRSSTIPARYSGDLGWWVSFLLINVVLGGFVGAAIIAYELFFIRSEVLKNRHLFDRAY